MLAIPSPDVLMNLFASGAQVMGLLVLCLSGGLLARKRMPGAAAKPAARWPLATCLLLLVATSGAFLLYHLKVVDQDNRRLQLALTRASHENGVAVGDASLKTLDYSKQTEHPRGVTTDQLHDWIEAGKALNLIDVREDEEVEMGCIAGTWHRRYPDLQAERDGLLQPGKTTILLCESGNRSSELSDYFHGEGLDTHFMIGGYEKWVAEGQPMQGRDAGSGNDLRALPEFANKRVLLDTDAATGLFVDAHALFVDVRYPKEFEAGHLPGAINIPVRKLRSAELKAQLAALPQRPIVVPCYDKRSSFYALVLGARLARMGYDFRGRYTVPAEFTMPKADTAWVAQWKAANAERTMFGDVRRALAEALVWLRDGIGSLLLAIVLAALLLRLALAPLTIKAERDGLVQRAGAAELAALRTSLRHDPVRLRRAFVGWLRAHRVSPGRNLLASLLQLLTFTAFFTAVDQTCAPSTETFAWLQLSVADATGALPLLVAALLLAIVWQQSKTRSARALTVGALFTAAVTALVWQCRAGVQVYLAVSFMALWLQGAAVRLWLRAPRTKVAAGRGLVPLALAGHRADLGGKASRLGELIAAGMPVPDGFVVPAGFEADERELDRAWRRLGAATVAVRSSACGEDGDERSFAGEFRTVLGVRRDGLAAAIAAVRASYGGRSGGVLVQALVPADHAGVLFTEDPGHAGRALVELIEGLGEDLVSGNATPSEFRFRRSDAAPVGEPCGFDLAPLLAMGRELERRFGAPQDIEWARAGGRFLLLQARPVTRRAGSGNDPVAVREAERARLLAAMADAPRDAVVFATDDYASLLPAPTTYSLSLMQELWLPGGTVDLACRRLGLRYRAAEGDAPVIQTAFGRCVVDRRRIADIVSTPASAAFRLGLMAGGIERSFELFESGFVAEARLRAAIDLRRLDLAELHQLATATKTRFLHSTYVEAEVVNLAAEAYVASARRRIERAGLDAAALLGQGIETVVQRAFATLAGDEPVARRCERFIAAFGHRAAHDFELAEARFEEQREQVAALAQNASMAAAAKTPQLPGGKLLRTELQRARRFQELKENAKDAAMRELTLLRAILRELGRRHGLGDLVFHLRPAEVAQLQDATFAAGAERLATERRRQQQWLLAVSVPDAITTASIEELGSEAPLPSLPPGGLRGARVAGDREPVGRVVVLRDAAAVGGLQRGDVLVVRCTDPCWLPAFSRVAGLVTEIGGWLSHAAIQAREHNLPAIVGAAGATAQLRDGELVRLRRDGVIERVADRRASVRVPLSMSVQVRSEGRIVGGRLLDVTDGGAALCWDIGAPPTAPQLSLCIDGVEVPASLTWTNCTRFGVRFDSAAGAAALEQRLASVAARAG